MDEKRLHNLKLIYGIALAFIALTLISSSFLMQYAIKRNGGDSRVINLSGRQRMLSQRLTKCVLALERSPSVDKRASLAMEITTSFESWKTVHLGLQRGNDTLGLPQRENSSALVELFVEMEPYYAAMVKALDGLVKGLVQERLDPVVVSMAVDVLLTNEPHFLVLMDKITFQFDKEAKERISSMQRLETIILLVGLLVLAFEFFIVFRPSLLQMATMITSLKRRNDELEAANSRISRLEGILPICMYCKKIRDDTSSWQRLETYITEHSDAFFSHGICPECLQEQMDKLD
jgi:hypothetical protein